MRGDFAADVRAVASTRGVSLMELELSSDQQQVLGYLQSGLDAFTGCRERGQYGVRMRVLASLRRMGLIDHHDHPTNYLISTAKG